MKRKRADEAEGQRVRKHARFVESDAEDRPAQEFKCAICLDLANFPVVVPCCSKPYCESCLLQHMDSATVKACPGCRKPIRAQEWLDLQEASTVGWRLYNVLTVQCANVGCSWIGTLEDSTRHAKSSCPFREVRCPRCKEAMAAKDMDEHKCPMRPEVCPKCEAKVPFQFLSKHLAPDKSCCEQTRVCKTCNQVVSIEQHDCPKQTVSCGICSAQVAKHELLEHDRRSMHAPSLRLLTKERDEHKADAQALAKCKIVLALSEAADAAVEVDLRWTVAEWIGEALVGTRDVWFEGRRLPFDSRLMDAKVRPMSKVHWVRRARLDNKDNAVDVTVVIDERRGVRIRMIPGIAKHSTPRYILETLAVMGESASTVFWLYHNDVRLDRDLIDQPLDVSTKDTACGALTLFAVPK
jgi:hypothetical protein